MDTNIRYMSQIKDATVYYIKEKIKMEIDRFTYGRWSKILGMETKSNKFTRVRRPTRLKWK